MFALDHVQIAIPAGGEDAARAFYAELLGFEELPKPPELAKRGGAWFRSGLATIHVGIDPAFVPAKKAHPALRCAEYAALLKRLGERGTPVEEDPQLFEGRSHCYVCDPFGNRIELIDGS